ncbi:MAG TPA: lipoyl(octanoyl) transferase LipB [Tepidisphaeraceae bacterium]|jgi:lipoate-protein ligase B|nr:lipoyl(octanoyl) transferase LipB [Tepidisphaeraceae bacterium]
MLIEDLGILGYRDTWEAQERAHAEVLAGAEERVLLVEHPPVITFGRRGVTPFLLASQKQLEERGVEVVESDRGGDVTFHGPGQMVAYPIIRLGEHGLTPSSYVHMLEGVVVRTLGDFGVEARTEAGAVGVWVDSGAAKIAAIGVRVRRGVSLHGLALNVSTDLRYFDLIVPCGLVGRGVTSLREILGERTPDFTAVQSLLIHHLKTALSMEP